METDAELIYSTLAAEDPSLTDLVEECLAELPRFAAEIEHAAAGGNLDTVVTLSHMLKGAAGSHGFMPVSQVAARLEGAARAGDRAASVRTIEELQRLLPRLRAVRTGEEPHTATYDRPR